MLARINRLVVVLPLRVMWLDFAPPQATEPSGVISCFFSKCWRRACYGGLGSVVDICRTQLARLASCLVRRKLGLRCSSPITAIPKTVLPEDFLDLICLAHLIEAFWQIAFRPLINRQGLLDLRPMPFIYAVPVFLFAGMLWSTPSDQPCAFQQLP